MVYFNKFKGTEGWLYMWERTIRFRSMRNKQEVERRAKILDFWKKHGEQAVKDAFGVSRRTLFRWQEALGKQQGHLDALDPLSTAPKNRRRRNVLAEVEIFIIREREAHPRLGKKKLAVLLRGDGYAVSESYVGRVISDLKERKLLSSGRPLSFHARSGEHHEKPVFKRKKLRRVHKQGMELDTIIRFIDGTKRYILTAIDAEKKFAFAGAYTSHSSAAAADFLKRVIEVCPFLIDELQTDNGSEFAKNFEEACAALGLTHFNTHVRSPKENAFIERFNRTISEDFIMLNRPLLRDDVGAFNLKMVDWLLWYNTVRPHESLGMVSPLRYIVSTLTVGECQRYWTRTFP
jgi:transposase InsO family protein